MRWHRKLIAEHHTYPHKKRVGRPGLMKTRVLVDKLVANLDPSRRSACSAESASNSLVIVESELTNSAQTGVGSISG